MICLHGDFGICIADNARHYFILRHYAVFNRYLICGKINYVIDGFGHAFSPFYKTVLNVIRHSEALTEELRSLQTY